MLSPEIPPSAQPTKTSSNLEGFFNETEQTLFRLSSKELLASMQNTRVFLALPNGEDLQQPEDLSPEEAAIAPRTVVEYVNDQLKVYKSKHAEVMKTGKDLVFHASLADKDETVLYSFHLYPFRDKQGEIVGVTTRMEPANELESMALRDPLTGLDSKLEFDRRFNDIVYDELREEHKDSEPITLLMIDGDHLKWFNDNLGHQVGDELLRSIADAIRSSTRPSDPASRYGGDEYRVILKGASQEQGVKVAEKIRAAIHDIEIGEGEKKRPLSVSIGVAGLSIGLEDAQTRPLGPMRKTTGELTPTDIQVANDMIRKTTTRADIACYVAKQEKNKVVGYEENMQMPENPPERNFTPLK